MPQDANCPSCKHIFPVTEARQPFTVPCPKCETDLTVEFKKPATPPEAGEPPYELLVKKGALPGHNKPLAQPKRKNDDDEDEPKRKGGSAMIVLLSGGLGLLFVLGGLGLTGWFLFTQLDMSETTSTSRPGNNNKSNNNQNKGGNNQGKGGNNNNNNNPQPPKVDPTFDLRPVRGQIPQITPPNLTDNITEFGLGSKVGAIAVGGGGRYIIMHFPQKSQLGLFDVSQPEDILTVPADAGDVKLTAGLDFAVVYASSGGIFRVYSLPKLQKLYDTSVAQLKGVKSIAMGSRTNGPLLAVARNDVMLLTVTQNAMQPIEGSFGQPGQHHDMLRAAPDGTAFATFDGFGNNHKVKLLTEVGRKWRTTDLPLMPFPGTDGNFYGNGAVFGRGGQQLTSAGAGTGSNIWMVPAVSGNGGDFVKMTPTTVKAKRSVALTIHANRNPDQPVPGSPTMIGPEIDTLMGAGGSIPRDKAPDHHLFYVPEARLLVILNNNKDKLILRKTIVN